MATLPPSAPQVGLNTRVRLGRDYYVRVAGNDYSVHPSVIGRFVDITADLHRVRIACGEVTVADHDRSWANHVTIADAQHVRAAKDLRRDYRNLWQPNTNCQLPQPHSSADNRYYDISTGQTALKSQSPLPHTLSTDAACWMTT